MAIMQSPSPLMNIISAKTYNAAWFSGTTKEAQITAAIAAAVADGATYVFVPANMLPYSASSVTFNTAIMMLAEGSTDSPEYSVKAYGAYSDGTTDDTAALTAAFAGANARGILYVPPGTYLISSSLTLNTNTTIKGVRELSIFKAKSTLDTPVLTLASTCSIKELTIDGANTTSVNATGLNIPVGVSQFFIDDCTFKRFIGTSSFGVTIGSSGSGTVLMGEFTNCTFTANRQNIQIGSTTAEPINIRFQLCKITSATKKGVVFSAGRSVRFDECDFESNAEHAVYGNNSIVTASDIEFQSCWFQSNQTSLASGGTRHADYHVFFDCTDAGVRYCTTAFRSCHWVGDINEPQALRVKNTRDSLLDYPLITNNTTVMVLSEGSYSLMVNNYPADISGADTTTINGPYTLPNVIPINGTFTIAFNGGTGTFTSRTGRYIKIGKVVHIWGTYTVNLIGTSPAGALTGLPFTVGPVDGQVVFTTYTGLAVGWTNPSGACRAGTTRIDFLRDGGAGTDITGAAVMGNGSVLTFYGCFEATV